MSTPGKAVVAVCIAFASFFAGSLYTRRPEGPGRGLGARRVLYYHDPMHPAYKSDKPGTAPDCGMQLEPVYEGAERAPGEGAAPVSTAFVAVTPEQRQYIGLRTEEVSRSSGPLTVRVLGRVALDETRIFRVTAAVDGWIREVAPVVAGNVVKKGLVLGAFYNRDFLTAQQTYLYALDTMDRMLKTADADQLKLTRAQVQAAEDNLEFLGMGEVQLREIGRTRKIARNIELRSPVDGLVVARNAFPGLRFERGADLFRIAELNHVWILADLFENEARLAKAAKRFTVTYQGRDYPARVSDALPQFDAASRVLKLRLEVDNPGFSLRPDMFVDVKMGVQMASGITVPADAVIDSGMRKTVYVELDKNTFEPRQVETGWRLGDRVQISKGVEAGERIVVSGNFLIDSESRMKLAAAGTAPARAAAAKDPVCGMDVDPKQPGAIQAQHAGITYTFCSKRCKEKLEAEPGKFLPKKDGAGKELAL